MGILQLIESDLKRAGSLDSEKKLNLFNLLLFVVYRHARVSILIRLRACKFLPLKALASLLLRLIYKIEIGEGVSIGKGIFFPHPQCIIISGGVVIGDYSSIAQYATIGGNQKKIRVLDSFTYTVPVLGDNVWVGPGAVIGGPVTVGNNVLIGANSVLTKDVENNSLVYGQNMLSTKKIVVLPFEGTYEVIKS